MQVSEPESGALSGMSEQERLAAERGIACQLLPITYDGSPLVRAELAAALARLATGHEVLFKVTLLHLCCALGLAAFMLLWRYTCAGYYLHVILQLTTFPSTEMQHMS